MKTDKHSALRRISIGIVAENKPLDSPRVQVLPLEHLNLMDDELTTATTYLESTGIDKDEASYTVKIELGSTIEAEWIGETNRVTSPDVRRGEQVWLYQQGDADKYYWESMGRDDDQRRLETVIYRFDGRPENSDEPPDEDNSYVLEVSTHKKEVTLRTSKRNGEFCRYTFQLNTGDGQATLQDDLGNIVQMDSEHTTIHVRNADMSLVEMNRKQIHVQSEESISFKTPVFNIESPDILIETEDLEIKSKRTRIHGVVHVDELKSGPTQTGPLSAANFNYPPSGGARVSGFNNISTKIHYPFPL